MCDTDSRDDTRGPPVRRAGFGCTPAARGGACVLRRRWKLAATAVASRRRRRSGHEGAGRRVYVRRHDRGRLL